jgi:CubicO group peptidase (beta-lactamase class C family)
MHSLRLARGIFSAGLVFVLAQPVRGKESVRIAGEHPASLVAMDSVYLTRVDAAIAAAIRDGATPGAALAVGRRGHIVRMRGYGRIDWAPGSALVTDSTLYDLASLTKVVGTTTAVMLLIQDGRLELDAPVNRYISSWPMWDEKGRITVRQLLNHTSGLPAGTSFWGMRGTRKERLAGIAELRLVGRPGAQTLYSDVGMILLGEVVEVIAGERMDAFLERRAFRPLEMADTRFNPRVPEGAPAAAPGIGATREDIRTAMFGPLIAGATPFGFFNPAVEASFLMLHQGPVVSLDRIAPTEIDSFVRRRHLHGEVHDLSAAALEGVAGHAGLFSSARDLARLAQQLLDAANGRSGELFETWVVRKFVTRRSGSNRGLGWEFPSGRSSAGVYFSAQSFGHTGFTGTSIWIDPRRDLFVVLLTNRIDPTAANEKHLALRREVHDGVARAVNDMVLARR